MKKVISFLFLLAGFSAIAQTPIEARWSTGFVLGAAGNSAAFTGGDITADARFNQREHGTGLIGMNLRYAVKEHWFLQGGLQLTSVGFSYSISTPYSLNFSSTRECISESSFLVAQVPVSVFYQTTPNCRNRYWIAGLGADFNFSGSGHTSGGYTEVPDSSIPFAATSTSFSDYNTSFSRFTVGLHAQIGRERVFNSGRKLNVSLVLHKGFTKLAQSEVSYTFDGITRTHQFENYGDFAGIAVGYYLKPRK